MPSPLDLLLDPVSLSLFALYAGLIGWEALFPARPLPTVRGWKLRGLVSFVAFFFVSSYLPFLWTETLVEWQLFDLSGLGTGLGALVGILVYELGVWAWHRAMHRFDGLWLGVHQMHHSAERLDTFGAFWFSPLDMVAWTALFSFALTLVVGLSAEATAIVILVTNFFSIFQHANVRTPRWLGYFVQRPESHSRHHERGVHAKNYSDLPLFDLVFGTFENPRDFAREAGFHDGASARVVEMLAGKDVTRPAARFGEPLRGLR
ncbi:MAG: sterol desaturase family protein [Planctomycetes bacterium]|nr:sterol desaturase family protein [Planctomycetota bacterium]